LEGLPLEIAKRIAARRAPRHKRHKMKCLVCGHSKWGIDPSFVGLPASTSAADLQSGERVFVTAPLTCESCGYLVLLNLRGLGFSDAELVALMHPDASGG
jgi:hypothetical protein